MNKYSLSAFRDNLAQASDKADDGEVIEVERLGKRVDGKKGTAPKKIYIYKKKVETYTVKVTIPPK